VHTCSISALYLFLDSKSIGDVYMKCIVCGKNLKNKSDVCKECDKLLDLFYRKHPEDKEIALQIFRKEASNETTP